MNKNKIENILATILLGALFGLTLVWTLSIFMPIFQGDREFSVQGLAAFGGAFFALIFTRLATFFGKLHTRKRMHYNSLVTLEFQLLWIGGVLSDNLFLLNGFLEKIDKISPNEQIPVDFTFKWQKIKIDPSHFQNLSNLELMNLLLDYYSDVRKTNDDLGGLTDIYMLFVRALLEKHIDIHEFTEHIKELSKYVKLLKKFADSLLDETKRLTAIVQERIVLDQWLGYRFLRLFNVNERPVSEEKISKRLAMIDEQLEEQKVLHKEKMRKLNIADPNV